MTEPQYRPEESRARAVWYWRLTGFTLLILLGVGVMWVAVTYLAFIQDTVRIFEDRRAMQRLLRQWGALAPILFIALQALQVIVSPIPGDVTGFLGGYLFGEWLGLVYSTVGLTAGSVAAFGVGRWLGARYVKGLVSQETWAKMGFIIEAEGAVLCFVIYLIPGLPKDIVCYLFGLSPMPFWVFAVMSTLGRVPGTWLLSAAGAHTASRNSLAILLLCALVIAVVIPLYCYRHRILDWSRERTRPRET